MVKAMQIALVLTALDRASRPVTAVSDAVGKIGRNADIVVAKLAKVQERIKGMADATEQFGRRTMIGGGVTVAAMGKVLQPFEDLEDATTRMELAYTNAQGKASRYFDTIRRQSVELGNQLPGTTRDFTALATALKEAAISEQAISGGGLKAAGYLRTIFDEHDPKKVAEVVAGSLHAFNLADNSLLRYIDIMQRAHYAFGMTLDDFKYGLPYIARSYGLLNPAGGLQAARNQTVMMGMLRQGGMEGSMIGESIGSFYTQLATRGTRMEFGLGRRGLMTMAGSILKKYGTDLTVFNKQGGYVGDEALIKQVWRLRQMGATAQEISTIGNALAGATGSTIFTKLYQQGPEGWAKANKALDDQLNLTQKIERLLVTLKNVKEAGMGTVTNLGATLGSALAPSMKAFFDKLNDRTGKLQLYFDAQEKGNTVVWKLTKTLLIMTLVMGALGIGLGAGSLALSALGRPVLLLISLFKGLTRAAALFRTVETVGLFGETIRTAGPAVIWLTKVKTALTAAGLATKGFMIANAALLAPLAAVLAVGAALYQLWKHWDTLKQPGFLKNLKGWVGSGFGLLTDPEKEEARRTKEWQREMEARRRPVSQLAYQSVNAGNVHFSPQIVIQGNADKSHVQAALNQSQQEFERMQKRSQQQRERRAF